MNQARLKFCAASVEWVKLKLKLSVCPRSEIDLAIELFNLETWNFQERQYFICFAI